MDPSANTLNSAGMAGSTGDATAAKPGLTVSWRHFALTLGLTAAVAAALIAVFGMRYEVNDDATISNIAAGAYGEATQYLVYVNVLVGFLLKPIYALLPGLNWFVVLSLAAAVMCFALLGALALGRLGPLRGLIVYAIFLLLTGQDFFTKFHYVKYAALFIATGVLLVAMDLGRLSKWSWLGIALAFLGSMLRFQQFVASGGMAAALLLFLFVKLARPEKRRAALAVLVMLALCFAAKGVDWAAYRFSDGWREFQRFNAVRTDISDFKMHFSTGPEDIEALGFTAVDYEVIDLWLYYDPEVFTADRLEEVAEALPGNTLGNTLAQTVKYGLQMLWERPVHLCFSLVLLAWLLFSKKGRWPALVGTLGLLCAMLLYLNWHGRYLQRVDYALALTAIIYCGACLQWDSPPKINGLLFAAALALVFLAPAWQNLYDQADDYWQSRPQRAEHLDALSADKSTLYLFDVDFVDAANGFDVWHPRPEGYFSNIVFVGSWLTESPFQSAALAEYGVANPYRDAIGREDVVVVDMYHRQLREEYLRQHYDPGAMVVQVGEGESYVLLRYLPGE